MQTIKIKPLPVPKEGEYDNLGYFLGMTIAGDDPYVSDIYAHFARNGELVMYNLTEAPFEHDEDVIDDLIGWLKVQLLDQYNNGCQSVKLIIEKKNGKLIFDMP
jgi:hypothetical protein